MIRFLKAPLIRCDTITALVIYAKDLGPQDRAKVKLQLMELKEAEHAIEQEMEP
jgi:hypothetical protein